MQASLVIGTFKMAAAAVMVVVIGGHAFVYTRARAIFFIYHRAVGSLGRPLGCRNNVISKLVSYRVIARKSGIITVNYSMDFLPR